MKLRNLILASYAFALILVMTIVFFSVKYMIFQTEIAYIVSLIMLVACTIAFFFSYLLFLPTLRSITKLSKHSNQLARGHFEPIANIRSPKELAELARDFNYMTERLAESFAQIKKSEDEKNTMISQLSHDIQTPITSIKSQIDAIMDDMVSGDEKLLYLESIQNQAMRLSQLSTELLDLTVTQERKKQKPTSKKVWIDKTLVAALNSFQVQIKLEDRPIEIDLDDEVLFVCSDEEGVNRIFYNLIANALKYSPPGTPIKVKGKSTGDVIQISIQDFGIGISEEEQTHIFERLYRVDKSRNQKYGGTGLGLYISQEIVKTLGGNIEVESSLGHGSTFTVNLPIKH
ncbi:HAMP domain-containing sensor histidine kinase [Marininema halotolerans]|uniref:histidine kinase n=1 Tax=Marininema halotolerans TaxID=1155944 RepID=A0A1I6PPS3_9BACL|nr:HAMP domain-containing sensor histidine kinase [Marininema halotolerans]SFS42120.1 two-component system, OmpR family, sensor histidine kinase SaeS [Marininema halotolerans]